MNEWLNGNSPFYVCRMDVFKCSEHIFRITHFRQRCWLVLSNQRDGALCSVAAIFCHLNIENLLFSSNVLPFGSTECRFRLLLVDASLCDGANGDNNSNVCMRWLLNGRRPFVRFSRKLNETMKG